MAFIDIDRKEEQGGAGDDVERQLSVRDVIAVLFIHKWTIIVSFLLILFAIYWGLHLRKTYFVGEVKYFVDRAFNQEMGVTWMPGLDWEEEINSIAELGRSQNVLLAVAREYETLRGNENASQDVLMEVAAALGPFLDVSPVPETDIISVTASDFDPDTSLILAEIYGRSFSSEYAKLRRREFSREFIQNNISVLEKKIETASLSRANIQEEAGIYDWRAVETRLAENRAYIQRELVNLRSQMEGIGTQLKVDEKAFNDWGGRFLPSGDLRADPQVNQFQRRVVELEMALSHLKSQYTDNHPLVLAKNEEIEAIRGNVREYFELNMEQRRQKIKNMKAMEEIFMEELGIVEAELNRIPVSTAKIKYYEDYLEMQWSLYSKLVTRFNEKLVDEEFTIAGNQLIRLGDPVIVDIRGLTPSIVNTLVAPLFSLILAISAAFMVEATSQSFQKPEDLERFTGLPVFTTFRKI